MMALGVCFAGQRVKVKAATTSQDAANMKKVLKYYKAGDYEKAQTYNKKLSTYANGSDKGKLTSEMKKAYLKMVKKYKVWKMGEVPESPAMNAYYLTDLDNDGKAELLVKAGTCEQDMRVYGYQYKKGKTKRLGSVEAVHTSISAYPKHSGVVMYSAITQCESMEVLSIKNGRLSLKMIGDRGDVNPYFSLKCKLKSYVDSGKVDYSPLQ